MPVKVEHQHDDHLFSDYVRYKLIKENMKWDEYKWPEGRKIQSQVSTSTSVVEKRRETETEGEVNDICFKLTKKPWSIDASCTKSDDDAPTNVF